MPGVRTASATTLALIGLLLWVLNMYVFKGNVPAPVSAAVYTIVPGVVGWVFTHVALNEIPPKLKIQLAAKLKNGQVTVLPDPPKTGGTAA